MWIPSCEFTVFWSLALLALGGTASVIAGLRCQGSSSQRACHRIFVTCLVGLGANTMLALTLPNSAWIPCAVAYALLAVAATVDFSPRRDLAARVI